MVRGIIFSFVLIAVICAVYFSGQAKYTPHKATLATYEVKIPKSCENKAFLWLGGKTHSNIPIEYFLMLRPQILACGGSITQDK